MSWEPSRLEQARLDKLAQLREAGIDAYPLRVERTHAAADAVALFASTADTPDAPEHTVTVCGRIVSIRDMGKTIFSYIEDGRGKIQLCLKRDIIGEKSHTM